MKLRRMAISLVARALSQRGVCLFWVALGVLSASLATSQAASANSRSFYLPFAPPSNSGDGTLNTSTAPSWDSTSQPADEPLVSNPVAKAAQGHLDQVTVLVDSQGSAILPQSKTQGGGRGGGVGGTPPPGVPNELTFTFDSAANPWTATEFGTLHVNIRLRS